MNELAWRKRLKALPLGARSDLLRVLLAESEVRADLIRQCYEREDTRNAPNGSGNPMTCSE